MGTPDDRDQMLRRHEIVVRIIDANSRRLHIENEINGLDIERRVTDRDLTGDPENRELALRLADITAKIDGLRHDRAKLEAERDWLDQSLGEFDGASPSDHRPSGRS